MGKNRGSIRRTLSKSKMSRREFCKLCLVSGATLAVSPVLADLFKNTAHAAQGKGGMGYINAKEAMYYTKLDEKTIQCQLCHRYCTLKNGMRGFCRVREARDGKQYTLVYGNPTAVHVDPIEKKPLYHFLPATNAFSIATAGCNYRCKNCQNWQISQVGPEETYNQHLPPRNVVDAAIKYNCPTIAYTYTEPAIFYEYMLDTAKIAKSRGVRNMYHSNGALNPKPAEELSLYLDGANVDLKGFTQEFYSKVPEGDLDTVLSCLKILKKNRVHLEITNLVVTSHSDDLKVIREMCRWIKDELGKEVPLHFSRFTPTYKLKNLSPTPIKTMEAARKIATEVGLEYVYIGNVPGHEGNHTYCPRDGKVLIRRIGYQIMENNVVGGKCKYCGYPIYGVWGDGQQTSKSVRRKASKYLG